MSISGLIPFISIARFIRSNMSIVPTRIPCSEPPFHIKAYGLMSALRPVMTPMSATLPPAAIESNDRSNVPTPPTSTTQSTPRPPVSVSTALCQSGVRT